MKIKTKFPIPSALRNNRQLAHLTKALLYGALGFVLSVGNVLDGLHPFGIAAVAVATRRYFAYCAVGAVLGTLLTGLNAVSARYLCAVALATLGALASAAFRFNDRPLFSVAVALAACLVTGLLYDLKTNQPPAAYLLTAGETVLCSGAAAVFYRALHANYKQLRLNALPANDLACILIALALVLLNTARLQLGPWFPAVTVAAAAVLTSVFYDSGKTGFFAAAAFGFALAVCYPDRLFMAGSLTCAAVAASLCVPAGTVFTALAFTACTAFFAVASGAETALPFFVSSAVGALLFVLLPSTLTERLEDLADRRRDAKNDGSLRQSLVLKLRFAGSAMAAISESVEQVREKINEITRRENSRLREEISEQEYLCRETVLEKTNQLRRVASDQFFSIADMLEDLAFEFDEAEVFDAAASGRIRRLLTEYDIYPHSISAVEDRYGRMRVEILTDRSTEGLDNPALASEIGKLCSRYFDSGSVTQFQNDAMLSFFERPNYRLDIGFSQHSAEGKLCGDTVKIINDRKGHTILIISDGMGTGSRAALDGAMGAGLLSKLINAGFGFDSALKVVNCALLVKSNDESLATLDIANIDLFTGKTELLKAGAPAGFLLKADGVTKCELSSMPAGILRGIEFARRTAVLRPEEKIVLVSDGVCEPDEIWLPEALLSLGDRDAQTCADHLLAEALAARGNRKQDDMSVIVATLERN